MVALQMLLVAGALGAEPEAVLLNFTQANCAPCRQMEPVLGQLEAAGLAVQNINVPQHPEMAQRFKLTGTPTYVMLVDGRETGRVVGTASVEKLKSLFPAPEGSVRGQSPDSGNYLPQKMNDMFGKGSNAAANSAPPTSDPFNRRPAVDNNVRNVSHEASASSGDAQARAVAATVRLHVQDAQGQGVGTGTIIDTHGDEAVLITCAHIFRDSQGKGAIEVDLFYPQQQTVQGKLLEYDLQRDIALVTIVAPGLVAAPVAPEGLQVKKADAAFSVGCDHGQDPSLRTSKITNLNRYKGPPNIEAAGEPATGRSGGGLFSQDGYLIGVCNCADKADDEGVYAALPTIYWQLDHVNLSHLYKPATPPTAETTPPEPVRLAETETAATSVSPRAVPLSPVSSAQSQADGESEVICIVRSKSNPSAKGQIFVIDRASPQLLQQLSASASDPTVGADLALQSGRGNPVATSARGSGPIVRGQSRR